jgi:hypothetical protein
VLDVDNDDDAGLFSSGEAKGSKVSRLKTSLLVGSFGSPCSSSESKIEDLRFGDCESKIDDLRFGDCESKIDDLRFGDCDSLSPPLVIPSPVELK